MSEEVLDFEREYSPSRWSPRFSTPEQVLQNHVKLVTEASLDAVIKIPHELDIEYGPTSGQKLDIFGTDLPNDARIFVYVHGGYWQELSREISRYPVKPFYRGGIKTIIIGYDLCPTVTLGEIIKEIQNAAKYVFEYAEKMNSRGLYFAGHSAGAHLVSKILDNAELLQNTSGSNRLHGVFLISGVYDLRDLIKTTVNAPLKLNETTAAAFSPILSNYQHIRDSDVFDKIRVHIIVGKHDSPTFQKQSRDFWKVLQSNFGVDAYLDIMENLDHFDIVEALGELENYLKFFISNSFCD